MSLFSRSDPSFEGLARLSAKTGVSLDWVATGEGPMRRGEIVDNDTDSDTPPAQVDLHILTEAEKLIDETLRRRGRVATSEVRASFVADTYGLIVSLIEEDIDEQRAIKAASNVVRMRASG